MLLLKQRNGGRKQSRQCAASRGAGVADAPGRLQPSGDQGRRRLGVLRCACSQQAIAQPARLSAFSAHQHQLLTLVHLDQCGRPRPAPRRPGPSASSARPACFGRGLRSGARRAPWPPAIEPFPCLSGACASLAPGRSPAMHLLCRHITIQPCSALSTHRFLTLARSSRFPLVQAWRTPRGRGRGACSARRVPAEA